MRRSADGVHNRTEHNNPGRNRSWWVMGGAALLVLSLAFFVTACSMPGTTPGGAAPTAAPALPTYAPSNEAAGAGSPVEAAGPAASSAESD